MTNFEKWKEKLSLDDFVEIIGKTGCSYCPIKICHDEKYRYMPCREITKEWAKSEVQV